MKNWIIVALIFTIPLCLYGILDANAQSDKMCKLINGQEQISKAKIIKFSSPMCSECVETAKEVKRALENHANDVILEEVNVLESGKAAKQSKALIKKYDVSLVPTLVFVDKEGKIVKKQEGLMKSDEIVELIEEIK